MKDSPSPTSEILVQHVEWLQRMARHLVRDEDLAQDLAQDALTVALARPPARAASVGAPRAWLRRVLRNLFHERLRVASSREARERAAARREAQPGVDELLARVQVQRRLADLLLELEEPARSTVLLRFYEDLPPREIARRQGVPVATVKSRLARALERLRERLDDAHGGAREAWPRVLAPLALAAPPVPSGAPTTGLAPAAALGGSLVNLKLILTATVLVVSGALFWRSRGAPEPERAAAPRAPADSPAGAASVPAGAAPSGPSRRRGVAPSGSTGPSAAAAPVPTFTVHARLVDAEGLGVHGVRVRLAGDEASAVSVAGDITLETTRTSGRLEVDDARWLAVRTGTWSRGGRIDPVLVVAPALSLAGRVVDEWRRGLSGARLTLELPEGFAARFEERLDASIQERWEATSGPEGAFSMEPVPAVAGAELRVVRAGKEPRVLAAPQTSLGDLWIELRDPRPADADALAGRVLRADRQPAADALVTLGGVSVPVDEQGGFVLDLAQAGPALELVAAQAGSRPARMQRDATLGERGWPDWVELVLGGPALSIEGRVRSAAGEPLAGTRVWVTDGGTLGRVGTMPLALEAVLAGNAVPDEALDSIAELDGGTRDHGSARPAEAPSALFAWVETDAEGRFALGGLEDRDYVLAVVDRELTWGTLTDPIAAGARGVEVVADLEATTWPFLAGRVVTEQGDPVPNVDITPWLPVLDATTPVPGGTSHVTRWFSRRSEVTDAQGRFELERVPRQHLAFFLISDDIVPSHASVEDVTDPDDFTIPVRARVHLEVVVEPGAEGADAFRLTDAQGAPVEILEMRADGYSNFVRYPLTGGRSGVVTTTSDALVLHLLRGDEELEAIGVRLRPGEVNTIVY